MAEWKMRDAAVNLSFSRPFHGLRCVFLLFPAINRWALVTRPRPLTGSEKGFCAQAFGFDFPVGLERLTTSRKRSSEFKANRRWCLHHLSRRIEPARLLIYSKDNYIVGFLIGHQQKPSSGIDRKVTWRHASSGFVANRSKLPTARINRENSNAIVPPVRTINKSSV